MFLYYFKIGVSNVITNGIRNFTKSLGHLLVPSGIRFRHSEVVLASDSWLQSERSERARNFEKMTSLHAFMENRNKNDHHPLGVPKNLVDLLEASLRQGVVRTHATAGPNLRWTKKSINWYIARMRETSAICLVVASSDWSTRVIYEGTL